MPDDIKEEKTGFAKVDSAAKTTSESRPEPFEPKTFKAADEPEKKTGPVKADESEKKDERTDEERAQQAEVDALNPLKADAYKTALQRDYDAHVARTAGETEAAEGKKDGEEGEVNRSPASAQDVPFASEPLNEAAAVAVDLGIPVHQANSMTAPGSNN